MFELLDEHIRANFRESGQFQLTTCLDRLRQEEGVAGYIAHGRRFEIGSRDTYLATLRTLRAE